MGYRLWFGNFRDLLNSDNSCLFGQLNMFLGENISSTVPICIDGKFDLALEDIDYVTAGLKNGDDFISMFNVPMIDGLPQYAFITHVYDGLKKDGVVYNSPLLQKYAGEVKKKKRCGYSNGEIWLDRSDELLQCVRKITRYIKFEGAVGELSKLGLSPKLVQGISGYAKSCERHKDRDDKKNFAAIYTGCLKYSNLRKLIVWEQDYLALKREKKSLTGLKSAQTRALKDEVFKTISDEERLTKEPLVSDTVLQIYNTRDGDGDIDWDLVWSIMSADDVYKNSNFGDLQRIGFFKAGESRKSAGFPPETLSIMVKKK